MEQPLAADPNRWEAVLEAGIAVASGLDLEQLLMRLVESARVITGARYAALGVLDESGTELAQFITSGIDDEHRARIGELPHGRGLLGMIIRGDRTYRVPDITRHPDHLQTI